LESEAEPPDRCAAAAESERWLPLLEPVDLPLGSVLHESESKADLNS
jgi:hypothetical protein